MNAVSTWFQKMQTTLSVSPYPQTLTSNTKHQIILYNKEMLLPATWLWQSLLLHCINSTSTSDKKELHIIMVLVL